MWLNWVHSTALIHPAPFPPNSRPPNLPHAFFSRVIPTFLSLTHSLFSSFLVCQHFQTHSVPGPLTDHCIFNWVRLPHKNRSHPSPLASSQTKTSWGPGLLRAPLQETGIEPRPGTDPDNVLLVRKKRMFFWKQWFRGFVRDILMLAFANWQIDLAN